MTDLNSHVQDLRLNVNRLEAIVAEVEQHVAEGRPDSAAAVLGSQNGKVGRFVESWEGLQTKLLDEGADPERALQGN